MPYSCQLQFGTSGSSTAPVGAGRTWRAIGLPMSQTSRLTMVQTTTRAPPGSFSAGRSTMAEKGTRSRGCMGMAVALLVPGGAALAQRGECLVAAHYEAKGGAHAQQRGGVQFGSVHGIDAVLDHHHRVVLRAGGGNRGEHAAVGVHAGHKQRVDAARAQDEVEVGAYEAVVAPLGI